jgi:thiol-disulfide isomerase/thioredoxin
VEEQTPIESTPQAASPPEIPPPEKPPDTKSKLLAGALLALVLMVGLYYVQRYWIAPAVAKPQSKSDVKHPLAPAFSLTDITGKPLKLADLQGKVVVLDFWASWCGPCQIEIPGFIELQKRYATQGFTMIGISLDDSPEPVVDFYKEYHMNYPVAVGDDRLAELYGGTVGLPTTFLIGRDGRIYAKHVGATDISVFETEIKELLAANPADEAQGFQQAGRVFEEDKVELGDAKAIDAVNNSEVPGVDITKLTADQKEAYKKTLEGQKCPCGCTLTVLKCRQVDHRCGTSRKMAQDSLDTFLKDKNPDKSPGVAPKSST